MLKKAVLVFLAFLVFSISAAIALNDNHTIIKYNIDNQNFTIVVVDDGIGYQEAKVIAMRTAAETSDERGFKYFKVTSENKVKVILGKSPWPNNNEFPQNLYEEQIIEKGFNRERFYNQSKQSADNEPVDAYRFDIQCVESELEAYKVCDYLRC